MSDSTRFAIFIMLVVAISLGMAALVRGFPGKGETVEQIPTNPSATSYVTP